MRDLARAMAETKSLEARVAEMAAAQRASAPEMAKLRERVEATEAVARETKVVTALPSTPAVTPSPVAPVVARPLRRQLRPLRSLGRLLPLHHHLHPLRPRRNPWSAPAWPSTCTTWRWRPTASASTVRPCSTSSTSWPSIRSTRWRPTRSTGSVRRTTSTTTIARRRSSPRKCWTSPPARPRPARHSSRSATASSTCATPRTRVRRGSVSCYEFLRSEAAGKARTPLNARGIAAIR